jgi:hypothetical protein
MSDVPLELRDSWKKATQAVQAMAAAVRRFGISMSTAAEALAHHLNELDRADWWKRGEGLPEYVAEREPPEWWQTGEEPPDFGCAA